MTMTTEKRRTTLTTCTRPTKRRRRTLPKGSLDLQKWLGKTGIEFHWPGYQHIGPGTHLVNCFKRRDLGINADFLKARFKFLLLRWLFGKRIASFLDGGVMGVGGLSLGISNQGTLYLVTSVLGKLDPGNARRILGLAIAWLWIEGSVGNERTRSEVSLNTRAFLSLRNWSVEYSLPFDRFDGATYSPRFK